MFVYVEPEENKITRLGKNICPICNKPKEMYYTPWCPRCDKPQFKVVKSLNLVQALDHLRAVHENEDIKDVLWEYFADTYEFRNDSSFAFGPLSEADFEDLIEDDESEKIKQLVEYLQLFINTFNITEDIILEVSW
jgi:hypothetical protein